MPNFEVAKIENKMLLHRFIVSCTSDSPVQMKKTVRSTHSKMEDVFPKYAQGSLEMQSNYGYFHNPRQFHTCCLGDTGGLNHS